MEKRNINNREFVERQYKDDSGLRIRKNLHAKYSVNRQGFGHWLFEILDLPVQGKILELGSGNGDFWRTNIKKLSEFTTLTLSDFSKGMVETMKEKFVDTDLDVRQIDIQAIPFKDQEFDVIIANAMLYHVPDLDLALKEVHRVLKHNGKFYASTFGENGLSHFISESLNQIGIEVPKESNNTFTLQNGSDQLLRHFNRVERVDYDDKLVIRDAQDLVDYIFSMTSMHGLTSGDRESVKTYFEAMIHEKGAIEIIKEYGSFICRKKHR